MKKLFHIAYDIYLSIYDAINKTKTIGLKVDDNLYITHYIMFKTHKFECGERAAGSLG